jgi:hypothetical protein
MIELPYFGTFCHIFIYSISFYLIHPMWQCRQILKHKIADMSTQRNQANEQIQSNTTHVTQKKSSSLKLCSSRSLCACGNLASKSVSVLKPE